MSDIAERLRAHMGLADIGDVLKDCRKAADRIEQLERENAELRAAGVRFLRACDAYVDGEDIPDDELMCEYGDSLQAFRRLAEQEGTDAS